MKKVLVDTNIFLDYYLLRSDGVIPIGEFAYKFIEEAINCRYFVLITPSVLYELMHKLELNEEQIFSKVFSGLNKKRKIEVVFSLREELTAAKEISKKENIPKSDCLLSLISKRLGVPVVT
ncbi:MAG: type II toxin-antitoxin system VapC family toxin, partial [Candidatus Diapherotrites archaeon]